MAQTWTPAPRSEPQLAGSSSGAPDPSPPMQLSDGDGWLLQQEVPPYGDRVCSYFRVADDHLDRRSSRCEQGPRARCDRVTSLLAVSGPGASRERVNSEYLGGKTY